MAIAGRRGVTHELDGPGRKEDPGVITDVAHSKSAGEYLTQTAKSRGPN